MMTLEDAILSIEDMVSGRYRHAFPKSELRTNTKEAIEFLKFNFETLQKAKKKEVKDTAFENILVTVLDDSLLPDTWQTDTIKTFLDYCRDKGEENRIIKYSYDLQKCINNCNTIITRLAEDEKDNDDTMSIKELNDKYYHKILYFNGDENGSQYVYVENIHKNENNTFEIDGVMVDVDAQDNSIQVHGIENKEVEEFYYFGSDEEPYEKCSELDEALQSRPCDTNLTSHVISPKDLVDHIISTFAWIFENDYDCEIKEVANILNAIKL